jgi:hypothetical protein
MAMATAEAMAQMQDFSRPLALIADRYAALHQCVLDTQGAAQQFHSRWLASGDPACQAAAQGLAIKGKLLHGLHTMRLYHEEWHSSTAVASPYSLSLVLEIFQDARDLCEDKSDAVQFPLHGLDPALAYLQQQVRTSRRSLESGEWQTTYSGQCHAEREVARQAAAHPEDTAPDWDPFDGVKAACRELDEVLQQLRTTLAHGPASRQAAPSTAAVTVPHAPAPELAHGPQALEPAVSTHPAAPTPLQAWERSFKSVLLTGPAAQPSEAPPPHPGHAASRTSSPPRPSAGSLAMPVAVGRRLGEAALAAQRRQERITALQQALAPLQDEAARLCLAAQTGAHAGAADSRPWAGHSRSFTAWQAATQAHDHWAAALAAHAHRLLDAGRSDPFARGLQEEIDTGSRHALDQAARAARLTLHAFSQDCHAALAQGQAPTAGQAPHAGLVAHCRDLQEQWLKSPLRPNLPHLEADMAQYSAFEAALCVRMKEPDTPAEALHRAEQLRHAAGQTLYARLRQDLLSKAAAMETASIEAAYGTLAQALLPVHHARYGAALAFDVLLVGDPLPDETGKAPAAPPALAQASSSAQEGDLALAQRAGRIANIAYARREQSIALPADAPPQAVRDLQAAQASLYQLRLTAQATAAALGGFHELAAAFDGSNPTQWPALARQRAADLKQLGTDLSQARQAHQELATQQLHPRLRALLEDGNHMLRIDRPLAARAQLALETLGSLLALRVSANQTRRRLDHDKLDKLQCPEMTGEAHHDVAVALQSGTRAIDELLKKDAHESVKEFWAFEASDLRQNALALRDRIDCDRILIQGKLLLHWGAKALKPGSPYLRQRAPILAFIEEVLQRSMELARINRGPLKESADRSSHGDKYKAQIAINRGVQLKLLKLQQVLQRELDKMPP